MSKNNLIIIGVVVIAIIIFFNINKSGNGAQQAIITND